ECPPDTVEHLSGIRDMVKRGRRKDGVDTAKGLDLLELDATIVRVVGCLRIDANDLVAARAEHRNGAAERSAAISTTCAGGAGSGHARPATPPRAIAARPSRAHASPRPSSGASRDAAQPIAPQQVSQQPSPRQLSRPSLAATAAMKSAAAGSIHQSPKSAFAPS